MMQKKHISIVVLSNRPGFFFFFFFKKSFFLHQTLYIFKTDECLHSLPRLPIKRILGVFQKFFF